MTSPFIQHEHGWYVWPFEQRPTRQRLAATLTALLQRHPPRDIIILRRMSPAEVRLLREHRQDCDAEVHSIILAPEEAG